MKKVVLVLLAMIILSACSSQVWGGSPTSIFDGPRPVKNGKCGHTCPACRLCAPLYMARIWKVILLFLIAIAHSPLAIFATNL